MHFKVKYQSLLTAACLMLVAAFILRLALQHQLGYYINLRYMWLAIGMASAACLLVGLHAVRMLRIPRTTHAFVKVSAYDVLKIVPIVTIICLLLLVPQRSLSSSTAVLRGLSQGSAAQLGKVAPPSSLDQYSTNFSDLTFYDWTTILGLGQYAAAYVGKPVNLTGFVAPANGDKNSFYLSRFYITCCTVDATPVGVRVVERNWATRYREGQWLAVSAAVEPITKNGQVGYQLVPRSIQNISEPKNPYAN